jgi:hypothetical protein
MDLHSILTNGKLVLILFFLLSLLVVLRVFIPRDRKIKPKDIFLLGHVFILTILLYGGYSYVFFSTAFHEKKLAFNADRWRTDREKRIEMLDDLVDRKLLESKDTNTVIRMLGAPVRIIRDDTRAALEFYTGFRHAPFEVDPTFLFVEITKGAVTDYYVIPGIPDIQ